MAVAYASRRPKAVRCEPSRDRGNADRRVVKINGAEINGAKIKGTKGAWVRRLVNRAW